MLNNHHKINTILLVDDEEGIRNVLNITLTHAGFKVLLAPDGDSGFKIFCDQKPDIVITDIKMPGIDGIELLQQIKQKSPSTEVIIITGHGDMDLAVKSLQFEAADFITKPIDSIELELSVKKAQDRISINTRIKAYMDDLEGLIKEKDRELDESQTLVTIGQTVAGMSHVIKNIAGGLKGSSFILEQGIETENREYLVKGWEMMKGNIDKITNLSLDLLNYAKTSRLNRRQIHPNQPVLELMGLLMPRAKEKNIEFTCLPLEEEVLMQVDGDAIQTALFNLITNALDACEYKSDACDSKFGACEYKSEASDNEGGKVSVSVEREPSWVVYQVRDNGRGMEDTIRQVLFKEFITTKGSQGTGFGLMTTQKIVDEHQGRIFFETQRNIGSLFTLKIPLAQTGEE